MPLTDTLIRNIKSVDKPKKMADGLGLCLLVKPSTSKDPGSKPGKLWQFRYRWEGKENTLSFGTYPEVSLKDARNKRDAARELLSQGINPAEARKAGTAPDSSQDSFEVVAREWFATKADGWAPTHSVEVIRRLEREVFPKIGTIPVQEVTAPQVLAILRTIEVRGAVETAHRVLQYCGQVMRYAVATGRAERDITPDLKGALKTVQPRHFSAFTTPSQAAALLRAIEGYEGTCVVKIALQLAPLLFVRPGELRQAQWQDVDLEAAEWRYTVSKTRVQHIVPLATQSVRLFNQIKPVTGEGRYVFPSSRVRDGSRPMSDMALLAALRRMGFEKEEQTVHGFRALARTILDEELGFRAELIEHQLAHTVRDPLGRAYNRTTHLPERKKMMQAWADYLEGLRVG